MQNIDINVKPSRLYNTLIITVLLMTLLIVMALPMSLIIKLLLCTVNVIYSASIIWTHGLLRSRESIKTIRYLSDRVWLVKIGTDQSLAELCGDSTITRWVSVLRFKRPGQWRKHTLVLFRDAIGSASYRQLLVQLRCPTS